MAFDPNLNGIDFVLLGGTRTPGVGRVEKANSPRNWDQRNGYGWSGSFPVFTGLKLSEFDVIFELWTSQDWADWEAFRPIIAKPPYGKRPKAIDVWHPWLEELGIRSAVIFDVLAPTKIGETGGWSRTIQMLEWRQPKITLAKPTSADKPKTTDPWDKEIERLTAQVDDLAK